MDKYWTKQRLTLAYWLQLLFWHILCVFIIYTLFWTDFHSHSYYDNKNKEEKSKN